MLEISGQLKVEIAPLLSMLTPLKAQILLLDAARQAALRDWTERIARRRGG